MTEKENRNILKKLIPDRSSREFFIKMFGSLTNIVVVLDSDRRLVYANQDINGKFATGSTNSLLNLRPGDIFQCVNVSKSPDGCGTSASCEFCGAFRAMDISRNENKTVTSHYRILGSKNGITSAFNFRFTSTPFESSEGFFYVITLEDISSEKRKIELERIFYHDLLNSLSNLNGIIHLVKSRSSLDEQYIDLLETNYNTIYDTVVEQKQISLAEKGELTIRKDEIHTEDLLIETIMAVNGNMGHDNSLILSNDTKHHIIESDHSLLLRVILNMVKNAMEAAEKDEKIMIGSTENGDKLRFWVRNKALIPKGTQNHIFQRSFSTKGSGRGLGTYSMKLLGENYLGGTVDFTSSPGEGTTFWIDIPKHP